MRRKIRLMALVAAAACLTNGVAAALDEALASITTNDLIRHIQVLASDEFEGRGPGTPGEERTVNYLIKQCTGIGLQPGNPDGSYFQHVPLVGITGEPSATLTANGKALEVFLPRDWTSIIDTILSSYSRFNALRTLAANRARRHR